MSKRIYDMDLMVKRALSFGPKTHAELVQHTSMSRETIRKALLRMKATGTVIGSGGLYRLPV